MSSIREAAELIGKSPTTLHRWKTTNPHLYRAVMQYAEHGGLENLEAELAEARWKASYYSEQCLEAQADEQQAMTYLEQCRQAIGHEGDFPSLVERLKHLLAN